MKYSQRTWLAAAVGLLLALADESTAAGQKNGPKSRSTAATSQSADETGADEEIRFSRRAGSDASSAFHEGNRLAGEGRWEEAQQAYLRALNANPGHPDILFNLAVSLDRLDQHEAAIRHYRQALEQARDDAHAFLPETALRRLAELENAR